LMPEMIKLDAKALYMAPSGRCCRWLPRDTPPDHGADRATFTYEGPSVTGDPRRDQFTLARPNWHLLRRVA